MRILDLYSCFNIVRRLCSIFAYVALNLSFLHYTTLLSGVSGTQSGPRRIGGDGTNHIGGVLWALSSMDKMRHSAQFIVNSPVWELSKLIWGGSTL